MILGLSVDNWISIISIVLSIIIIPLISRINIKINEGKARDAKLAALPEKIEKIEKSNKETKEAIEKSNKETKEAIARLEERQTASESEIEMYNIQNLKYMINDAFFGYANIQEIPYETLIIAADGCDIYTSKGYNHEIGARCKIIYKEIERRQKMRSEGEKYE